MAQFMRIKHYVINMETLTYVRAEEAHMDFGFAFPTERPGGRSYVRLEKGKDLSDEEFEEVKAYVFNLADPDRILVI
jgi:hypothetical protein